MRCVYILMREPLRLRDFATKIEDEFDSVSVDGDGSGDELLRVEHRSGCVEILPRPSIRREYEGDSRSELQSALEESTELLSVEYEPLDLLRNVLNRLFYLRPGFPVYVDDDENVLLELGEFLSAV